MDTLDYARAYLAQGWKLFPMWGMTRSGCGCGDPACSRPAKHPLSKLAPNGVKNATGTLEEVEYWLDEYPDINLAVATGKPSGVVVLDVDWEKGGAESFGALLSRHYPDAMRDGIPMCTRATQTGGGGLHFYFQWPRTPVKNTVSRLGPGIDVRGDGGSAILPPSVHASGVLYQWDGDEGGMEREILPMPSWLQARAEVDAPTMPVVRTGPYRGRREPILHPGRNNELTRIAGGIHAGGASLPQLRTELQQINRESCIPPLPEVEVDQIAMSIGRYPR